MTEAICKGHVMIGLVPFRCRNAISATNKSGLCSSCVRNAAHKRNPQRQGDIVLREAAERLPWKVRSA